jgi:hypothetical protein
MGTLHTVSAPPPALYATGDRPPVTNAYFAITVEAAVDLRQTRRYQNLPRAQRVAKALAEQQGFLDAFADPALGAALDLRVATDPKAGTPLSVTLLGRVWGNSADEVTARAVILQRQVFATMPPHVTATVVEEPDAVARLLAPLAGAPVDSAVITRHELTGPPSRPDAGVSYYYSAGPFNWSDNDWSAVYAALATSPVPAVLSVAVLPLPVPPPFAQTLQTLTAFYGRLAREGEIPGSPYARGQRVAPDPFAVDAEKAFRDFSARLGQQAFALRIQVSAARQLPPGLVETIAAAVSPAEPGAGGPDSPGAAFACDIRRPASVAERRLAEYNLNVINFGMLTGQPDIWNRPDPPDPQLAMLAVLGDARDAACAFRFPVAADGVVPGFRVHRDRSALPAAPLDSAADGPVIRIGTVPGSDKPVSLPLRALTRPALIAGSAGSGKTTTALELLRQLWTEHEIPFLVIEPANSGADDYRRLAAEPGFESLEVVTVGDEGGAPLRFNPFAVPAGVLVGEHTARLLACFKVAFGLPEPLPSVYQDALILTYLRSGFLTAQRPTDDRPAWPTAVDFQAAMGEVTRSVGYAGEARANIEAATARRAQQLVRGITGSVFLTDQPGGIGRLLDHPVILELKSLGPGDEQALLTALVLSAVAEHGQSVRDPGPQLVHVTLVEEAHRLLGRAAVGGASPEAQAKEQAAAAFAATLAENHRYGAGVIMTERFPARLVADAVKNADVKIMHRLAAADDRRYLGETMGMDETQRRSAGRRPAGEALLYRDELGAAAPVHVTRTRAADAPPPAAVLPPATPPFAACDSCRAQCAYRGAALSIVHDPVIVNGITSAAGAVGRADITQAERQDGLDELQGRLLDAVGQFAALPAADPGRSDAAFCLFLHVYATSALRTVPQWPAAVARLLGITAAADVPDPARTDGSIGSARTDGSIGSGGSVGDGILQAAGDLAGQAERATRDRRDG